MIETDCIYQEKKEEEDLPVLGIALIHQLMDSRITSKRSKKDLLLQPITALQIGKQQKLGNRNKKQNSYMNISSNKLVIVNTRREI